MSVSVLDLVVSVASPGDAVGMVEVIHAAFGARPALDPPSTAIDETTDSVVAALARGAGIYAAVDDQPAGTLIISPAGEGRVAFQRVSVHPEFQRHGVASVMVEAAEDYAAELGYSSVELFARAELPELIAFWKHRGFAVERPAPHGMIMSRRLPTAVDVPSAAAMQLLGSRLTDLLHAGDVIVATGDLGAGKTTLTQGIGAGLGVAGPVISPTFVLSRVHSSTRDGPALVHVDAYRLSSADEVDDLDLEATLGDSVTVVEWGAGLADHLSEHRLEIDIRRTAYPHVEATGPPDAAGTEDHRMVIIRSHGDRWQDVDLAVLRDDGDQEPVVDA